MMLKSENILIISTTFWDGLQFRRQIFARNFSVQNKVLYINPLYNVLSFIRDKDVRRNYFKFLFGIQKVTDTLGVVTLPPLIPFARRYLIINKLNRKISRIILNFYTWHYFRKQAFAEIVYLPQDTYWVPNKRSKYLIYDCVDEHSEYPYEKRRKEAIIELEKNLLRKADIVFVTGRELLERKSTENQNIYLVPNGVDFELFSKMPNGFRLKPEIASLRGPIVLYIGGIFEWFDFELLKYLARERPQWNFLLIGPTNHDLSKYKIFQNIHYVGSRKKEELPDYLKRATVCIIPFILDGLTHSVNPLKLYEYWASGKPVVSVAMKELLPLEQSNILEIGRTKQEFLEKLDKNIATDNYSLEMKRRLLAEKYSWPLLFQKYSSIISQNINHK